MEARSVFLTVTVSPGWTVTVFGIEGRALLVDGLVGGESGDDGEREAAQAGQWERERAASQRSTSRCAGRFRTACRPAPGRRLVAPAQPVGAVLSVTVVAAMT